MDDAFGGSTPQQIGPSVLDVLLLPGICCFIGLVVFYICVQNYNNQGKFPKTRWWAYGITLLGVIFSGSKLWEIINPVTGVFMRASIVSKKVLYSYYLVFPIALACLVGLVVWERLIVRSIKEEAY